jgi:hypothetical protein
MAEATKKLNLPLEATPGAEISQVITTAGNDRIRVVRLSPRSAAIVGEDAEDIEVMVIAEGDGLTVIAKGFWGELWDAAKTFATAGAKAVIGANQKCKTSTTQTTTFSDNGQLKSQSTTRTTECTPA